LESRRDPLHRQLRDRYADRGAARFAAVGKGVRAVRPEPGRAAGLSTHSCDPDLPGLSNRAGSARNVVMRWVTAVGAATERGAAYVGGLAEIGGQSLRMLIVSPLKRDRMLGRAVHEAMAVGVGAIPIISLITFFIGVII